MDELQLVGYTADLRNLVFSDDRGLTRYKAPLDEDLLATLEEVLGLRDPEELAALRPPAPEPVWEPPPPPAPAPEPVHWTPDPEPSGNGSGYEPGVGALAAFALASTDGDEEDVPEAVALLADDRASSLTPRQIQSLLRAGSSPRVVAREAGTDEGWVRRWLPPIEAEREQVLAAVRRARVEKARLGTSRDPVGEAVRANLRAKGLDEDDESVEWHAARGEKDDRWTVTLRYRSRGRMQRALWRFDADSGDLEPRNKLAVDIAWTRGAPGRKRRKPAATRRTTKKASARSTPRPAAKKATRKRVAKKSAGNRAGVKKATQKRAAKKSAGKRAGVKKVTRKRVAKKSAGKRAGAKKATQKRAAKKSARR